jgi:hypothetical protein
MRGAIAAVLIVGVLICAGFVIVGAAKPQQPGG